MYRLQLGAIFHAYLQVCHMGSVQTVHHPSAGEVKLLSKFRHSALSHVTKPIASSLKKYVLTVCK